MPGFSNVTQIGHLTRDPELRDAGQSQVCKFGIATNYKFGGKEEVCFIDCECWGARGVAIAEHFKKGKPILVNGTLRMDSFTDKSGNNRTKHYIKVETFEFLPDGGGSDGPQRTVGDDSNIPF